MNVGALLYKETLVQMRSSWARRILLAYLGALAAVILLSWPSTNVLTMAAAASQRMLMVLGLGQLLGLLAIIPAQTAGAILTERDFGSLELLQASKLKAHEILLGKWFGAATYFVVLLICTLPMLALCLLLGTMPLDVVAQVYLHLLATVLSAGMVGLAVSSIASNRYSALMTTYVILLLWNLGPLVPSLLRIEGVVYELLWKSSSVGSMIGILAPDAWRILVGDSVGPHALVVYLASSFPIAVLAALVVWKCLLEPYHPPAHGFGRLIDDRGEIRRRKLRFPFYLVDPQRRRRHIGDWINPILARELRSRMLGQATIFLRVFFAMLIGSLALTLISLLKTGSGIVDSVRVIVIASQVAVIGLLSPPLTAPAVSRERELGTLELLRMTKIGPLRLLLGNWYYALIVATCIMIAAVPMWYVIFAMQRVPTESAARAITVVVCSLFCSSLISLFASSICARTSAAAGLGYVLTGIVLFGSLLTVAFAESLSFEVQGRLLEINPIAAAVRAVSLGTFRHVVDRSAWLVSSIMLVSIGTASLAAAYLTTRILYRSR